MSDDDSGKLADQGELNFEPNFDIDRPKPKQDTPEEQQRKFERSQKIMDAGTKQLISDMSPEDIDKVFITWEQVQQACHTIKETLSGTDLKGIIAISRGGCVPAVMLSHLFDIPIVGYIKATSYDKNNKRMDKVELQGLTTIPLKEQKQYLIVDDIYDTGETAKALFEYYPQCYFGFLTHKTHLEEQLRAVAAMPMINKDDWVVFPWEL